MIPVSGSISGVQQGVSSSSDLLRCECSLSLFASGREQKLTASKAGGCPNFNSTITKRFMKVYDDKGVVKNG